MLRATALVVLLSGCLAVPPDPRADGEGEGAVDAGAGQDAPVGIASCVPGTQLDLVWVNEVAFDHLAQSQVTLLGIAVVINSGPEPIRIDELVASRSEGDGGVTADFTLEGGGLTLAPAEMNGAVSTEAAGVILGRASEDWTNFAAPKLEAVLHFDGASTAAVDIPISLDIGGFAFDVSLRVLHDPDFTPADWARDADRTTALCE